MESKIIAIRDGGSGEEVTLKTTRFGSLQSVQYHPYGTALTAKGESWQVMTTAAVPSLVVRPTVLSMLTLYNGEAAGGKSYIIDRLFAHALVSDTADAFFHIWACVHHVGTDIPGGSDITAFQSNRGITNYGGNAICDTDETVHDDGWFPWGPSSQVEATGVLPGSIACAEVNGRLIVPPTAAISLITVASIIYTDCVVGLSWFEEVIDLG